MQLPLVAVPDHPLLPNQHVELLRQLHQAALYLHRVARGRRLRPCVEDMVFLTDMVVS